jgi:hypothetical protein
MTTRLVLVLFLFGVLALVLSGVAAAGGHGSYDAAKLLFPFTMLVAGPTGTISGPALAIALAQYPLYGWLISRAKAQGSKRHAMFFLAMLHCVAVYACGAAILDGSFSP